MRVLSIPRMNFDEQELKYLLDLSARKLRYKSERSIDYVNKLNNHLDDFDAIPPNVFSRITSHQFYITLRNLIRDLLTDWCSSQTLFDEEIDLLRNCILFLNRLVNVVDDVSKLTPWLVDSLFVNSFAKCLSSIDRLLLNRREKHHFKQLIRLFNVFSTYYQRSSSTIGNELDRLFEGTMDCLVSSNYDRIFRNFKPTTRSMTSKQNFFLIKCPSLISIYHGSQSHKIIHRILDIMFPRYALLLDQHIQSIKLWNSPLIHAIHHALIIINYARGHYSPYATGQPLQWLLDHIIRIISESSFRNEINEQATTSETVLIKSALRTLTGFVREPDLLVYMKQLKITSVFRSLSLLPNESIVLHAYVMLSYTLEEDDIKASPKESGRLLSKIFDALRKELQSLFIFDGNDDLIERNISLLIEALQALIQHDQIKSEILKQNALSLFIDGYQYFNHRSKRLILEALGSITFDKEAARLLRHNTKFIDSVKDIQATADLGLKKAAERIIWNLINEPKREKKVEDEQTDEKEDQPITNDIQYDIMISYCHADKEIVYRIHKFLSEKGFKIWFDRDNIYGPAMQAMAEAVENSEFVLLCMSDSYKRSAYCQAEAEYAFHCKRNLLPCIVRQGYRADGWLGIVIGSRIYVDFGRLEFKDACELLTKEITLQRENQLTANESTENKGSTFESADELVQTIEKSNFPKEYLKRNTSQSTYRSVFIDRWTKKDVLDYLYDADLCHIMPMCELMTGPGLIKLFRLCQAKPSQFYRRLNEELSSRFNGLHLPIGIFTQFLSEMEQLIHSSTLEAIEQDALQSESVSPLSSTTVDKRPPSSLSRESSTQVNSVSSLQQTASPFETTIEQIAPLPVTTIGQVVSPSLTTVQTTSRNVQITERTAYRTESLVTPANNLTVQASQDSTSVRSQRGAQVIQRNILS